MPSGILIGLGSGFASAVLAYSAARGDVLLKFVLFILTPLPMLIAALGWGWRSAAAATLAGVSIALIASGAFLAGMFLLALGLPALLVAWLADLGRSSATSPADPSRSDPATPHPSHISWFPAGHLLAALAAYASMLPVVFAVVLGGGFTEVKPRLLPMMRDVSKRMEKQLNLAPLTEQRIEQLTDLVIELIPATISMYWLLLFAINVYLAGRVARASGHLTQPWPDLHRLVPPAWLALLLAAAAVLVMLPAPLRMLGAGIGGALLVAYTLLGLSVLHAISAGRVPWLLWGTYALLINPAGPYAMLLIACIGLIEPLIHLRERLSRAPPTLSP
jgi:Predicted membrane protein (DUF2232)